MRIQVFGVMEFLAMMGNASKQAFNELCLMRSDVYHRAYYAAMVADEDQLTIEAKAQAALHEFDRRNLQ